MTLPTDMSFMDLLLDKEDNLLNFDKDLIGDDMKFSIDHKNLNNDDWSNDVDFLDSLLEMEDVSQSFDEVKDNLNHVESDDLVTPAGSVIESSSCSDSGVSCDQQMSPMVQDMEDIEEVEEEVMEDIEEVVVEEEVYTDPVIKEEVVEIDDDSNLDVLQMDSVDVKQEANLPVVTLNVSQVQPVKAPPMVRVNPVPTSTPRRVIRVTPLQSNNPRSILIPVNGVAGVRTIKIINAGSKTQTSLNARAKQLLNNSAVITTITDDKEAPSESGEEERETVYPRLQLTAEERRLMAKEGITLPSHYPLTKHEERELKRIRRKIRNKISAQDSRKRKKEYVDGLEERVKQCTEENLTLLRRLKVLQTQNQSLVAQLRSLRAAVVRGSAQTTQPATCLMVLVLSLALVMAPNLRNSQSRPATDNDLDLPATAGTHSPLAGRSRTLLFSKHADQPPLEEALDQNNIGGEEVDNKKLMADLEDLLQFKKPQQDDHDYSQAYTVGRKRTKTYIVPDIDDTWPPPKIPRQDASTQPVPAHNKTRTPPEERKFIVELPE